MRTPRLGWRSAGGPSITPRDTVLQLASPEQVAAIDALSAEEVNLADELRGAIAAGERGAVVGLLTALGAFWAIRGEHARLVSLTEAMARHRARLGAAWRARERGASGDGDHSQQRDDRR